MQPAVSECRLALTGCAMDDDDPRFLKPGADPLKPTVALDVAIVQDVLVTRRHPLLELKIQSFRRHLRCRFRIQRLDHAGPIAPIPRASMQVAPDVSESFDQVRMGYPITALGGFVKPLAENGAGMNSLSAEKRDGAEESLDFFGDVLLPLLAQIAPREEKRDLGGAKPHAFELRGNPVSRGAFACPGIRQLRAEGTETEEADHAIGMILRDLHRPFEGDFQIGQGEACPVPLNLNRFAWTSIRIKDRQIFDSLRPDMLSREGCLRFDQAL